MKIKYFLITPLIYSVCMLGACNAQKSEAQDKLSPKIEITKATPEVKEVSSKTNIEKYPMLLIWDDNLSVADRDKYISDPGLNDDLVIAFEGMIEASCADEADVKACLANPPTPNFITVFEGVSVATPDLNNDGKRDLIFDLSDDTGLSIDKRCGKETYWIYENSGSEHKKIGTLELSNSEEIYVGKPKDKGQFRDIITKESDAFCAGEVPAKFHYYKFDNNKEKYSDIGS